MSHWKWEQSLEGVKCEKCQKALEVSSVFLSCTASDKSGRGRLMTELSGEALDAKIAPIAGLVEGVDFWGPQEHNYKATAYSNFWECRLCHHRTTVPSAFDLCYKPAPAYHESLDLLLPVVRKVCEDKENRIQVFHVLGWKLYDIDDVGDDLPIFLADADNPARLLTEALVEAVGGEN